MGKEDYLLTDVVHHSTVEVLSKSGEKPKSEWSVKMSLISLLLICIPSDVTQVTHHVKSVSTS